MKRLALVPTLLLAWVSPVSAATSSTPAIYRDLPRACIHVTKPRPHFRTDVRCVGGVIDEVDAYGLKLNLPKGPDLKVLFSDKTMFVTESAAASLVGLTSGDFACVEGAIKDRVQTALEVLFDTNPFPCGPVRKAVRKASQPLLITSA